MANLVKICSFLLLIIPQLFFADLHLAVSADTTQFSPTPAPQSGESNSPSLSPESGGAPAAGPATDFYSPPSPSPSDLVPTSLPSTSTPSPITSSSPSLSPSPSPSPLPSNEFNQGVDNDETADSKSSSSEGGLKGGQKAGIAIGVIGGACIVDTIGIIYKKRQNSGRRWKLENRGFQASGFLEFFTSASTWPLLSGDVEDAHNKGRRRFELHFLTLATVLSEVVILL